MLEAAVLETPAGTPLLLDLLVCRLGVSFLDQFSSRIPADVRAKCDPWDVLQDTLVKALTSLDRFQGASEEDLLHWLRVLYRSRSRMMVRRFRQSQKRQVSREVPLPDAQHAQESDQEPVAKTPDPPAAAIQREENARGLQAFKRLPERDCAILDLKIGERLTFEQAGERLGISADAARMRYERALGKFRAVLKTIAK
jgi:RNA polymerase sigma-70 factor (ECF subfamily)